MTKTVDRESTVDKIEIIVNETCKLNIKLAGQISPTLGKTVHDRVDARLAKLGLSGPNKVEIQPLHAGNNKNQVDISKENQKFYLELQELDTGGTNKPWHHFPKEDRMYGELVFVTPAMAMVVLQKYNPGNRRQIIAQILKYARDMVDGNWFETGESVQFDTFGGLVDGQHRLLAILLAQKIAEKLGVVFEGAPLFCVWNVNPAARFVVDSGANRPEGTKVELIFGDELNIPKNSRTRQFFAICRAMMNGVKDRANLVLSHAELAYFGEKYASVVGQVMQDLQGAGSQHGIKRADLIAAIAKAYLWYGRETIHPFCSRLGTVLFDGKNDPAYLLYNLVIRGGVALKGVVLYKKTLAAIEHNLARNKVNRLLESDRDFFDWQPNWEVPKRGGN